MTKGSLAAVLDAAATLATPSGARAGLLIGNLDGDDGTSSPDLTGGRVRAMGFTLVAVSDYILTDTILRLRIKGDGVVPTIRVRSNGGANVPTTPLAIQADPPIQEFVRPEELRDRRDHHPRTRARAGRLDLDRLRMTRRGRLRPGSDAAPA